MPRSLQYPNLPSTTEILQTFGYYKAYHRGDVELLHFAGEHNPHYESNCALCRGSWIDKACAQYASGQTLTADSREQAIGVGWLGYYESFCKSWNLYNCSLIQAQGEVVNLTLGYVGHYDLKVQVTGGTKVMWEMKAGELIDCSVSLQLASYTYDHPIPRYGIGLREDGSPAIVRRYQDSGDYNRWFTYCLAYGQMVRDGVIKGGSHGNRTAERHDDSERT